MESLDRRVGQINSERLPAGLVSKDRVVLITGASGGIGLATAYTFAPSTSHLFLLGRNPHLLTTLASDLKATPLVADVTDEHAVQRVASAIEHQVGRLDVLVNCAGQLEVGPADQLGLEVVERLIRVNFLATVSTIHACLSLLRQGKHPAIVNVSSIAGRLAPPYMAAYAASKFALNGYSHALRQELQPQGIHVGLVLPGPVDTPMVHGRLGGPHYPVPPGIPVLTAGRVAAAILDVVERRIPEMVLPRRLASGARLGSAFPSLVDRLYKWLNCGSGTSARRTPR